MKSYYSHLRNATVILFIITISFQINAKIKKTDKLTLQKNLLLIYLTAMWF